MVNLINILSLHFDFFLLDMRSLWSEFGNTADYLDLKFK